MRTRFLCYTPFTGLGLYGGFRGNRWLRNRIKIFKQFVIPSLQNQTDRDFIHWISWRKEEKNNPYVMELYQYMKQIPNYNVVFTYGGVCFWDDKFPDDEAHDRLYQSLKSNLVGLMDVVGDVENVMMLLVPSDDLYEGHVVQGIKTFFDRFPDYQAVTFDKGYICNYNTKRVLEYNPNTNPPFFCIRFPKNVFFDPMKHINYTGPYKSHEYVGDKLKLGHFKERGFMVGTHGENISTHFNHPFGGSEIQDTELEILYNDFGIQNSGKLELPKSFRKWIIRKLPYKWQKKFRYWWGEKMFNWFYNFIRN